MNKPIYIISGLLIALSSSAIASESTELDQAIRQLQSAEQALLRAQQQSKNAKYQSRFYFDYHKARQEIVTVRQGIYQYMNADRAQPRDPNTLRTLSGNYKK